MDAPGNGKLHVGHGLFDPLRGALCLDGRTARLRPRTAALLSHLVQHQGRVVGRDELMRAVWPDAVVTEESITQCVKEIRQALGDAGRDWIRTLPRQGYAFIGEATAPSAAPGRRWVARAAALATVVILIVVAVALLTRRGRSDDTSATSAPSLVVLPIGNATGDPAHEKTVDGMTEALTDTLARTAGTAVIASATAFTYKGTPVDVRQVGAALNVRYVLYGSLRVDGSTLVLAVRLADAASALQLWNEDFRASAAGEMRELVAGRVADTLGLQMGRADRRGRDATAPSAMGPELLGRARALLRATPSADERELHELHVRLLFERTVQRAGGSMVDAWVLLAGHSLRDVRFSEQREAMMRRGELAVRRALELGPDHDAAVQALGSLMYEKGHMELALAAFERVIELNPNNREGHALRGAALVMLGQPASALASIDQAIRLSPRDPMLSIWQTIAGVAHLHLGHDALAAEWLARAAQDSSTSMFSRMFLASALAGSGRIEEAKAEMGRFQQASRGFTLGRLRALEPSTAPAFLRQRQRVYEGLRRAGMPE